MRIIRFSDLVESPWRNGGGIRRDVASERQDGTLLWQLSMADVTTDGPFSDYSGMTRIMTLVEGDGLLLHTPDTTLSANYARPVVFDGATPITSELTEGPIRNFNLLFDTARWLGEASVLSGHDRATFNGPNRICAVHCIKGHAVLNDIGRLGQGDTAIATDSPVDLVLETGDIALCIGLRPLE